MNLIINKRIIFIFIITLTFIFSIFGNVYNTVYAQAPDDDTLISFIKKADPDFNTEGVSRNVLEQKVIYELTQKGFSYNDAVMSTTGEVPENATIVIPIKKVESDTNFVDNTDPTDFSSSDADNNTDAFADDWFGIKTDSSGSDGSNVKTRVNDSTIKVNSDYKKYDYSESYTGDKDTSVLEYASGFNNIDEDINKVHVTKGVEGIE